MFDLNHHEDEPLFNSPNDCKPVVPDFFDKEQGCSLLDCSQAEMSLAMKMGQLPFLSISMLQ